MDVLKEELNDELLSEICRIKSTGSPLSKFGASGNCFTHHWFFPRSLFMDSNILFFIQEKGGCQVFNDSESRKVAEEIAERLGKSTGLYQT